MDEGELADVFAEAGDEPMEECDKVEDLLLSRQPKNLENYTFAAIYIDKIFTDPNRKKKIKKIILFSVIVLVVILIISLIIFLWRRDRAQKRESMEQMQYMEFLMEHALEMILVFDRAGTISYANTAAREKLQYGDDNMCGRHISEVFPNTFTAAESGFEAECEFGDEPQNLVAYRKKRTCFPV